MNSRAISQSDRTLTEITSAVSLVVPRSNLPQMQMRQCCFRVPPPYVEGYTGTGDVPHGVALRRDGRSYTGLANSLPCRLRLPPAISQQNRSQYYYYYCCYYSLSQLLKPNHQSANDTCALLSVFVCTCLFLLLLVSALTVAFGILSC